MEYFFVEIFFFEGVGLEFLFQFLVFLVEFLDYFLDVLDGEVQFGYLILVFQVELGVFLFVLYLKGTLHLLQVVV